MIVRVPFVEIIDDDDPHRICVDLGEDEPRWIPRTVIYDQDDARSVLVVESRYARTLGIGR